MHINDKFRPADLGEILAHIDLIRFGTLVSCTDGGFDATPIPWVAEIAGGTLRLFGHLANANPHLGLLEKAPHALVVFTGENGYISPRGLPTPKSAPTWNYIAVHVQGRCEVLDAAGTEDAVERLVTAMEHDRTQPWITSEMAERRGKLLPFVTGIRLEAERIDAKLKLGQNERLDDLRAILDNLEQEGRFALAAHMRRANADRLDRES